MCCTSIGHNHRMGGGACLFSLATGQLLVVGHHKNHSALLSSSFISVGTQC